MAVSALIVLILLFFLTSIIGVVTGSNSLITVPVMFQFGIEPRIAVATNMFGLTFLNIGASLPFLKRGLIKKEKAAPLVILTILSSAIGATLLMIITNQGIKLVVFSAMILVLIFTLWKRDAGLAGVEVISLKARLITYILTFILGIYGGLYSGGYATVLTTVYIIFFRMSFAESIAYTKFINIFSSLIASTIFAWQGLIDYKLGLILAVTMFSGAFVGAHTVTKLNDIWLRRIFIGTVIFLAVKTFIDFLLTN